MKHLTLPLITLLIQQSCLYGVPLAEAPIQRQALVTRHNIDWNDSSGKIPLGNGEFCFTADGTGLQTFGGNSMSHWGWHSFPLPADWTADQVPATGTFQQGRNQGLDLFPTNKIKIRQWMFDNPHLMNLGRLRFCKADGAELKTNEITGLTRTYDLWSGIQTARYQINGEAVRVETAVHPTIDGVAVRIESPLVARGELQVALDFPYPALQNNPWVGDFSGTHDQQTAMKRSGKRHADFVRRVDETTYHAAIAWSKGGSLSEDAGRSYRLSAKGVRRLEFICAFSAAPISDPLPTVEKSFERASAHWNHFWQTGGAIDLSSSKDKRWFELERRIVLSQYLLAAQSAGSFPSSEAGLMEIDPWRGQFHMEMVWWHLSHYALWDRWSLGAKSIDCYQRFAPAARALATQLGYAGLKWPKSVGPEGRSAPWTGNQVLLWKEPHPIFFAELEYRLRPTRATLEKWADVVQGTADHMADYPLRDEKTGVYSLVPAMPPSERGVTRDTVFDLAYWRFGLDTAQAWRLRLGLARNPHWDEVRSHLAPLPVSEGVYVHSAEWLDTYTRRAWEHPDPIGVLGMLPPMEGVDRETAHRTVLKVWKTWDWNRCWGWDFPWMAMAAARTGEPQLAIDALLKDSPRNTFDTRGGNGGGGYIGGHYPYLSSNGGLLYAVAMMAAGWDGCPDRPAPGFPADGSWTVKWEGLKPAP